MSDELTLPQKIERLGADADAVHAWANGDEITSVELGGMPTPSPRKMMHDLNARESLAAQEVIAAGVAAAENSATAADHSAQIAEASAAVVTAHAAAINLIGANIEAIQGAPAAATAAANSADAAAASAAAAAASVPENLLQRVAGVEEKNTQQDNRLTAVETKNTQQDTALAGKANADMGNVTTLPQGILAAALNASGSAPMYACRAWAAYNGVSNAILASGNFSSVTKVSTGRYTFNFATPMPDSNYTVSGVVNTLVGDGLARDVYITAKSASSFQVQCNDYNAPSLHDCIVEISVVR